MQASANRARTISRLWAVLPIGGVLLVAAAVYERIFVKSPHVYQPCREEGSLLFIFWTVALVIVVAGMGCLVGAIVLLVEPPVRITAPLVFAAIALIAVVGADGLDRGGAGIAARAQARYEHAPADTCDYPIPVYNETPGWFF